MCSVTATGDFETFPDKDFLHIKKEPDNNPPADYTPEAQADFVRHVPGFGIPTSNTFAGFINVKGGEVSLFYVFVEAKDVAPENAPLVLWQNGGPGCSSLYGFLEEVGPYLPKPGTNGSELIESEYAWTRIANIVFLEVPGGTGFSRPVSNGYPEGTEPRDEWVASQAHEFLLSFMVRYPQYKGRPLWLTGESYAGHYTPQLAVKVADNPGLEKELNLQGYTSGNAFVDGWCYDNYGFNEYFNDRTMLSLSLLNKFVAACGLTNPVCPPTNGLQGKAIRLPQGYLTLPKSRMRNTRSRTGVPALEEPTDPCIAVILEIQQGPYGVGGPLDFYNVYSDVCLDPPGPLPYPIPSSNDVSPADLFTDKLKSLAELDHFGKVSGPPVETAKTAYKNPCIDYDMSNYLARPDVLEAFHVEPNTTWFGCSDPLFYNWNETDTNSPQQPFIRSLLSKGNFSILFYSGDLDSVVPPKSTLRWLTDFAPSTSPYTPWVRESGQLGGHYVKFQNVVFTTVRGAGHFVPLDQPAAAFQIFQDWIANRTCIFNSC